MDFTDAQIEGILDEVQGVLATVAKSEKDKASRLAKAIGEPDGDEASAPPGDEASAPPGAEASAPPPGADAGPPPGADAGPPPGADAGGDPAADASPDPAALMAEYSKLPLDQLKMHAEVAMQALQAAMGAGAAGAPGAGGPPPGADAGPPGAGGPPPGADMGMGKKEFGSNGSGGELKAAKKAEKEISDLKKSLAEQADMTSKLTQAFTAFVSKPMRKAEVALSPKAAPTKLAKSEVKAALTAKIQDRSLTKNDRELINRVLLDQPVADAAIAHLLKV
jgi:hypothetical protein